MKFEELFQPFIAGTPIKRQGWQGYWTYKYGTIDMHTKDGRIVDFNDNDDVLFTISNLFEDDWEVATEETSRVLLKETDSEDEMEEEDEDRSETWGVSKEVRDQIEDQKITDELNERRNIDNAFEMEQGSTQRVERVFTGDIDSFVQGIDEVWDYWHDPEDEYMLVVEFTTTSPSQVPEDKDLVTFVEAFRKGDKLIIEKDNPSVEYTLYKHAPWGQTEHKFHPEYTIGHSTQASNEKH